MHLLNTATILALMTSVIIPHASSLLSNNRLIPAWAGGYVTLVLAAVSGFCSEWAAQPNHYNWKQGALTALGSFLLAALSRIVVHQNTPPEADLLDVGAPRNRRHRAKGISRARGDVGAVAPLVAIVIVVVILALILGGTVNVWFFLLLLVLLLLFL
jgi:hypothetical protein